MSDYRTIIESKLSNLNLNTSWLKITSANNLKKIYRIIKYNFNECEPIINEFLILINKYAEKCEKVYKYFNHDLNEYLGSCNNILQYISNIIEKINIKYNKLENKYKLLDKDKNDIIKFNMMLECTNTLACVMFKINDGIVESISLSSTTKYIRINQLLSIGFNMIYLIPTSKFTISTDPNIRKIIKKYGTFCASKPQTYENVVENFEPELLIYQLVNYTYQTTNKINLNLEENKEYKLHLLSSNDNVNLIHFEYKNKECIVTKLNIIPYDKIDLNKVTIKLPNIMVKTLGIL